MPLRRSLLLAASLLVATLGIGSLLTIGRLWCDTAAFADSQMRPVGAPSNYEPPPGPIYLDNDAYYWLSYAQRIARGEDWRIRHTMMDDFPTGREMHWSQSVSWSLVLLGKIRALFTGEPLATAVEKASTALNPLIFALAAVGLFLAMAPRFGTWPVALFLTYLGTLGDVGWTFQALRPGHQSFHVVFGAGSVLGLILGGLGLTAPPGNTPKRWPLFQTPGIPDSHAARRWFSLAGLATGLGYWVSATIESFFIYPLIGMFIVLLVLLPSARVAVENLTVEPDLWRRWGLTAGATAFLFYLLEYFPHHMAMRIEVNHPVYDLALVGAGEALRLLTMLRWGGRRASPATLTLLVSSLLVAGLPVLLIARGPVLWHHMRDPQMLRLHNFIQEFYTYNNFIKTDRLQHLFVLYGILPLISLLTPFFLLRRNVSAAQVTWLWSTFALACSFGLVSYIQIRWMGFFAAAVCLSALVTAHFAFGLLPRQSFAGRDVAAAALILILLVQPFVFCRRQVVDLWHDLQGNMIQEEIVTPILNKRMAYRLKASPNRPRAIIAGLDLAPSLGYFAGIPTLASFYWENTDGLHDAVRFFATKDPAEARDVAVRTGATHVIIPSGGLMPNYFYFVAYGHYDTVDVANTFVSRLLAGTAPLWIQRTPCSISSRRIRIPTGERRLAITWKLSVSRIEGGGKRL